MATTKEELQERAQLVRIHEANCKIEYPTREEANFRIAIMKKLGIEFCLRELRAKEIAGPTVQIQTSSSSNSQSAVRPGGDRNPKTPTPPPPAPAKRS